MAATQPAENHGDEWRLTWYFRWGSNGTMMALKLSQFFYLLMEKRLGRYFQVWSPCYQAALCIQKTHIPMSSRWQVISEKAKKISFNTKQSYDQHSSPQASLNWSSNKIRFSFNQPNRKMDARLVDVIKHLPHKVFVLWHHHEEGGQPRIKSISMSRGNVEFLKDLF